MKRPRSFWRDLTYVDHCSMLGSFYNRDRQLQNLRSCSIIKHVLLTLRHCLASYADFFERAIAGSSKVFKRRLFQGMPYAACESVHDE